MDNEGEGLTFQGFLDGTTWFDFESYLESSQQTLREEIRKNVESERRIRANLRKRIQDKYNYKLQRVSDAALTAARETLAHDVVAIDGTRAQVSMLSGIRGQLGVVAIRYSGETTSYVAYVTELSYADFTGEEDVEALVERRNKDDFAVSDLVIRATLAYEERRRALEQSEKWCILQGELFPFELRSGLGKLKALDPALALFRAIADRKTIGAVVSDTTSADINYGYALETGEYFSLVDLKYEYEHWLKSGAKFHPDDKAKVAEFAADVGQHIMKGVFRVGQRPFIFYAHEECFDEFASLIIADSMQIPERGFPLLIDYADSVCSTLFRASDFEKRVYYELAREGDLLSELSERANRAR